MDNSEFNKLLLDQLQEKDETIKYLVNDATRLMDLYIKKDKEKDRRHMITTIGAIGMSLLTIIITFSIFFYCYFYAPYTDHNENTNVTYGNNNSSISGNNNSNNKFGGEK